MTKKETVKSTPPVPEKKPRAPRRTAKYAELKSAEEKIAERDVRIADIGKIAKQVVEMIIPLENAAGLPGDDEVKDQSLVKMEAILALVRGEDLGEWARARIGL